MEKQKLKPTENELKIREQLFELLKNENFSTLTQTEILEKLNQLENEYQWYPYIYHMGDKCGIKLATGQIMIPAEYDDVAFFPTQIECEPSVAVCKAGKWALVTTDGSNTAICDFKYDNIAAISGILAAAKLNDKYGYLNIKTGEEVSEFDYDMIYLWEGKYVFMHGFSEFSKNGLKGISNGVLLTKPIFDEIVTIPDNLIQVKCNGIEGFIDENANFTTDEEQAAWGVFL